MVPAPLAARRQSSSRARSPTWFSTPGTFWYHSSSGFTSTARMRLWPRCRSSRTRCPPMNPPAPVTTTRSFLDMKSLSVAEGFSRSFNGLRGQAKAPQAIGPAIDGQRCRLLASGPAVKSLGDAGPEECRRHEPDDRIAAMVVFTVNGESRQVDVEAEKPLL